MASPSPPKSLIDPHRSGRYTVHLADGLIKKSASSPSYTSVKFNHKPTQTSSSRKTWITPGEELNNWNLKITDKDSSQVTGIYAFKGKRSSPKQSYILIFDPSKQECRLEPLSALYAFNLSSPAELARRHAQIQLKDEAPQGKDYKDEREDLFGDTGRDLDVSDTEAAADANNPFDYRHFLHQVSERDGFGGSQSPEAQGLTSSANTPRTTADAGRLTPQTQKPAPQQTRKAAATKAVRTAAAAQSTSTAAAAPAKQRPEPQARRRKSPPPPPPSQSESAALSKAVPKVRLDRRASTRPNDTASVAATAPAPSPSHILTLPKHPPAAKQATTKPKPKPRSPSPRSSPEPAIEEEGGLEIDFGPPKRTVPPPFLVDASAGPISLRSAANSASPSSRLHTPLYPSRVVEEPDVIDFGGNGDVEFREEDFEDDADGFEDDGYVEDDEDGVDFVPDGDGDGGEGEGDGDVEPMSLGSPAHVRQGQHEEAEDDDLDDDFAKMLQEMDHEQEEESGEASQALMDSDDEEVSEEE